MTAETDLLPCPWCGEKLASVSVSEGSTFHWRKVDGCCADGPEVRHNTMADDQEAAEDESRAAAIAAWNTRAQSAEIEALRTELDRLRGEHVRVRRDRNAAQARAERMEKALRLIESAKDRGFGINYARGVAQSVLAAQKQEGRTDG